jgi:hypothetical protein
MATKAKRRKKTDDGKARLRKRLKDLAYGAYGPYNYIDFDAEDIGGMAGELGLDGFARWLGAIKNALLQDADNPDQYIAPINLDQFDTMEKATDYLWERGIRP